jgi:TDG/mug DNA glycosylase family protein
VLLPDVLGPDLDVVFCGTAVGDVSARVGAYYAGPGNQFWPVLARVGLTPRALRPDEYAELPKYRLGLSDLVKLTSGGDVTLAKTDFDVDGFRVKIETHRPRAVAFNGKRAAEVALRRPVDYGAQAERIGDSHTFVLPSTSGAARGYWNERYWSELADFVRAGSDHPLG